MEGMAVEPTRRKDFIPQSKRMSSGGALRHSIHPSDHDLPASSKFCPFTTPRSNWHFGALFTTDNPWKSRLGRDPDSRGMTGLHSTWMQFFHQGCKESWMRLA